MARTEDTQESNNSKTLLIDDTEIVDDSAVPENESATVKTSCQHITKAVDANNVRKNIRRSNNKNFASLKCSSCKSEFSPDIEDKNLLLCLKCGSCNCVKDARHHFRSPHSDPHNLAAKLSDWTVWCFTCEVEIPSESSGKLKEGISSLRKEITKASQFAQYKQVVTAAERVETSPTMEPAACCSRSSEGSSRSSEGSTNSDVSSRNSEVSPRINDVSSSLSVTVGQKLTSGLPSARGLCNLGNTCFFNSVLQCLAQTPFLIEILLEISEPGQKAVFPIDDNNQLAMDLEKWGKVTEALATTLRQLTQVSGNAYNPIMLLNHLREKYRQFKGYNQHDAHELLRQLLDSVKTEDIRRYQTHILRYFGVSSKMNPAEVDEKKRTMAKELNQKITELVNIRPDPVFKGTLVSTHQCMKCHHQSSVVESFLDLSLPVSFSKSQNIIARKSPDFTERPKSKHRMKKEKKAARKANKLAKKRMKDDWDKFRTNTVIEMKDINESGYSSCKATTPELVENHVSRDKDDKEILAEALSEIDSPSPISIKEVTDSESSKSVKSETNANSIEKDNKSSSSEDLNVTEGVNGGSCDVSPIYKVESEFSSQSPTPDMRFQLVSPLPNNSLADGNSTSSSSDNEKDEDDDLDFNAGDEIVDDEDVSDSENQVDDADMQENGFYPTLQPPSEYEDNSIQACLSEFTAREILSGSNSFKCDSCTERQSKNTGEKKAVYQPITKQLLIKYPPPVLILHLKRFEVRSAFSFSPAALRKADKTITFPLILDIGSFCSVNCENLLIPNQKKILYSLYGVVEHSGSLNAGHYVAYVKVRKPVERNSYRRLFLPKGRTNEFEPLNTEDLEQKLGEHMKAEKQWYYISDSFVRPIAEEEVLHKQAYLLFYERIL